MNIIKHCRIHCLSETLSPLTHMMGSAGNESIINREEVISGGKLREVPVLSGNAIRHRMIREPGGLYIIKVCGLEGKLNLDMANYLLTGGILTESSTSENMGKIAEMQEILPLYRLLGGSLRNQVVGGSLFVDRGILICAENAKTIEKYLPEGYSLPLEPLRSAEDFISQYQYTRGDAGKRSDAAILIEWFDDGSDDKKKSNLMIYSGQMVKRGAFFYHGFSLQNVSPLEVGSLLHALQQWEAGGSTLGGSARIGHGRIATSFFFQDGEDFFGNELNRDQVIADYIEHTEKNKERIVAWLEAAFPRNEGKSGKKKVEDPKEEGTLL